MLTCDYIVIKIDGDYAHLKQTGGENEETKQVARALLPPDIYEGCRVHYEMLEYSMQKAGESM